MTQQEIREVPFTNDIGQTINPGDPVVSVTTSYSSPSVRKGVYIGLNKKNKVQIRAEFADYGWVSSKTGEACQYNDRDAAFSKYKIERLSTLQLNRIYKIA